MFADFRKNALARSHNKKQPQSSAPKKRKFWRPIVITAIIVVIIGAVFLFPRNTVDKSFRIPQGAVGAVFNKDGLITDVIEAGTYSRSLESHTIVFRADEPELLIRTPSNTQHFTYTGDYTKNLAFTNPVNHITLYVSATSTIDQKVAVDYLNARVKKLHRKGLWLTYSPYQGSSIEELAMEEALRDTDPTSNDLRVSFIGNVSEKPFFTCGTMAFTSNKISTTLVQYQQKVQKIFGSNAETSFQPLSVDADSANNTSTVNC